MISLLISMVLSFCAHSGDFGEGNMKINDRPATGVRAMFLAVVQGRTAPRLSMPPSFYRRMVFGPGPQAFATQAFSEISNGLLTFNEACFLGGSTGATLTTEGTLEENLNTIIRMCARQGFDLRTLDTDRNNTVSKDELAVVMVDSFTEKGGARRVPPCFRFGPDAGVNAGLQVCAQGAGFGHRQTLATMVHELTHTLGAIDLYGLENYAPISYNNLVSLMSDTNGADWELNMHHLDPWHKLQLGWVKPRVNALASATYTLAPAQLNLDPNDRATAPLLIYDPARGTNEYFLIEYRSSSTVGTFGVQYDQVGGDGVAIYRVKQNPDGSIFTTPLYDHPDYKEPHMMSIGAAGNVKGGSGLWHPGDGGARLEWDGTEDSGYRVRVLSIAPDKKSAQIAVELSPLAMSKWQAVSLYDSGTMASGTWGQDNPFAEHVMAQFEVLWSLRQNIPFAASVNRWVARATGFQIGSTKPASELNSAGDRNYFVVTEGRAVLRAIKNSTTGVWGNFRSIGSPLMLSPVVTSRYSDGRFEVYGKSTEGLVEIFTESSTPGSSGSWTRFPLDSWLAKPVFVGRFQSGQVVFGVSSSGEVNSIYRTSSSDSWHPGGTLTHPPGMQIETCGSLATHADGRLELFCRSYAGNLVHAWTDRKDGNWSAMTDDMAMQIQVAPRALLVRGKMRLLAISRDGLLVYRTQTDSGPNFWSEWKILENAVRFTEMPELAESPSGQVWITTNIGRQGNVIAVVP